MSEKNQTLSIDREMPAELSIANLFDMYKTDVFRFALSITRDTFSAQDVTQQVFLKLIQNIHLIADTSKIKSWLLTTTKNTAINMCKRSQIMQQNDPSIAVTQAEQQETSSLEFFELLDCLDETERLIVVLHIVTNLKHMEIAALLGKGESAVRMALMRARRQLRDFLQEGGNPCV